LKSHVSSALRSLEGKGLLRREFRNNDRRTVHLVIEEPAWPAVQKGLEAQERFLSLLSDGITEAERSELERVMEKLGENALRALEELR